MRNAIRVGVAVAIAAMTGLMAAGGTASASATGIQSQLVGQARAAGISVAQADKLQQEVTSYIREHGGTQVALNVVDFPGGSITFVVPGEKYARDLATQPRALASGAACSGTTFCAYEDTNFLGSEISIFKNCEYAKLTWFTQGSYINHLATGVVADWYNVNKQVIYVTPAAPSSNASVSWIPVNFIRAC
jgi:hypothetical protein